MLRDDDQYENIGRWRNNLGILTDTIHVCMYVLYMRRRIDRDNKEHEL